ncbi:MAG: hypothetical protein CHACPFDD_00084 [Phycisphaerae bacterium]|nr:hypothetical protein [Phycisphaerae bacterium]
MSTYGDKDEMLDRNLRQIGRALELPPTPTAAQRAAWTLPPSRPLSIRPSDAGEADPPAPHAKSKGKWLMQRPRMLAAGAVLAACAALFAFFLLPSGNQAIAASTIFRSLREAVHRGLAVELVDIQAEGVIFNGRVQLLFDQPFSLASLDDPAAAEPEPQAVYAEFRVRGDGSNDETAGLDVEVSAGLTEQDKWAFVRLSGLPNEVMKDVPPFVPFLLNMTRNGLLLDLNGLEELESVLGDDEADEVSAAVSEAFALAAGESTARPDAGVSADSAAPAGVDQHPSAAAPASADQDQAASDEQRRAAEIEAALHEILSGTAGAERIALVARELEQLAGKVAVNQVSHRVWELSASEFRVDADSDEAAFIGRAKLTIRYAQGSGIVSAELAEVGPANGRIRFGFIDEVDPTLLSRQRFIDRGIVPIDVGGLITMFGGSTDDSDDKPDPSQTKRDKDDDDDD